MDKMEPAKPPIQEPKGPVEPGIPRAKSRISSSLLGKCLAAVSKLFSFKIFKSSNVNTPTAPVPPNQGTSASLSEKDVSLIVASVSAKPSPKDVIDEKAFKNFSDSLARDFSTKAKEMGEKFKEIKKDVLNPPSPQDSSDFVKLGISLLVEINKDREVLKVKEMTGDVKATLDLLNKTEKLLIKNLERYLDENETKDAHGLPISKDGTYKISEDNCTNLKNGIREMGGPGGEIYEAGFQIVFSHDHRRR